MPRKKRKKSKKSKPNTQPRPEATTSAPGTPSDAEAPSSQAVAPTAPATGTLVLDACGEEAGDYGEVIIHQDGSADLHYDSGGIPWFMYVIFAGFLIFAVGYCATYLIDFS